MKRPEIREILIRNFIIKNRESMGKTYWMIYITDYNRNKLKDRLEKFRMNWQKMLQREMGERDGSALAAILLGEKSGMDQKMKELYQVNGIGHILAISGLHLSFAGLGVYRIARRMTCLIQDRWNHGGILLCLYVMMIGMTVSVIRAWVMLHSDRCGYYR